MVQHDPLALWHDDAAFLAALGGATGITLLDPWRLYVLWQFARRGARVIAPGAASFAEVGVYKGGSAVVLANAIADDGAAVRFPLHLFDTFQGLPAPDRSVDPSHNAGDFADTTAEKVAALFAGQPFVHVHPGLFPATAKAADLANRPWAFVHIDVDLYRPTLDCLEFFGPKLVPSGVVMVDDYGFPQCKGVRRAVDVFLERTTEYHSVCLPTGQMLILR